MVIFLKLASGNNVPKMSSLLTNIHETAAISKDTGQTYTVTGNYEYYHYLCDGFDDRVRY